MRAAAVALLVSTSCSGCVGLCLGLGVGLGLGGLVLAPHDALAAPVASTTRAGELGPTLPAGTLDRLKAPDAATFRSALDDVRLVGKSASAAAPLVARRLDDGLPIDLTTACIETLGDLEEESTSASLARYAVHRTVAIREAAVKALGRTRGPAAVHALKRALADAEASVRGAAATSLGALRAADAVGDLFLALDRRVNEAALAIGQICGPADCDKLGSELGKLPFDVVTPGLEKVLFRPGGEVSDEAKIRLVASVRELGTMEANTWLRGVQARWAAEAPAAAPASGKGGATSRVRQAIDQAVFATSAGAK